MIPVKDHKDLARGNNGVIHNVDREGYAAFISQREKVLSDKARIEELETKVSGIESTLKYIVYLLEHK